MAREDAKLKAAKISYKTAKSEGNREEEARWANVIGNNLKDKGEYVEALKWLRIDYDVSSKYLLEKDSIPTCQCLGEVYLRLEFFEDALVYQKKHLELAKDAKDLVEQQRACTQLGRTYYEMFLRSENDHYSLRNSMKHFKSSMKLVETLRSSKDFTQSSFLKEYIDAHNNLGMLEKDLDNMEAAQRYLIKGLKICDEEEVGRFDDGRSRLHHNLGNVYIELAKWNKAREHIQEDIAICTKTGHRQEEAKGYISLGELHFRVQKYEDAILCYRKALELAKSMEDEDALVEQANENIKIVTEAMKVFDDLKKEEQNLKKLTRNVQTVKGTPGERKCLLQQNASLDLLIEKSSTIFAWLKHLEYAKRKKGIARELCDKEKLYDSFLVIGESYQKLRKFSKAIKWYTKSWEGYRSICNLEGQALAKINIGDVLDFNGDSGGALAAFQEGYRNASEANLPSLQLSALENMHYIQMMRFNNVEEARRLQVEIDKLKDFSCGNLTENMTRDCCSETDTEGDNNIEDIKSDACSSGKICTSNSSRSQHFASVQEMSDDTPLISVMRSSKVLSKIRKKHVEKPNASDKPTEAVPTTMSESVSPQTAGSRKRVRVILSDDERESQNDLEISDERLDKVLLRNVASSNEYGKVVPKIREKHVEKLNVSDEPTEAVPTTMSKSVSPQTAGSRKRVRVVLSDDEGESQNDLEISDGGLDKALLRNVASSNGYDKCQIELASPSKVQEYSPVAYKGAGSSYNPLNIEQSSSCKSPGTKRVSSNDNNFRALSIERVATGSNFATSGSKSDVHDSEDTRHRHSAGHATLQPCDKYKDQLNTFKFGDDLVQLEASSYSSGNMLSIESLKVELACLYYLQLPQEKRSKGLLPIIQRMECCGGALETLESFQSHRVHCGQVSVDVFIDGWVQKRLLKLYIDCCKELSEAPDMKLIKKLYVAEIEDEVNVSECELQDISVTPLLNALQVHRTVAMLDLSHNLLGNGTMEKIKQMFTSTSQIYGDLTLDLHCNRFGPTSLFQICECPVLFTRLEVLNVSGNRLTDACGSYLSRILENCKVKALLSRDCKLPRALYSLNIERCNITSRTIQKVADALAPSSILSQLSIGCNDPITGRTIINLLDKLAVLQRFSDLNLNGLKLSKPVLDSLSQLAKTSSLSRLVLAGTGIGTGGALQLTESLFSQIRDPVKLDLSCCGLKSPFIHKLSSDMNFISGILELNIGQNIITQEGICALTALLMNPRCCLKVLILNNCQLGLPGILHIIQAVADNEDLEELNLADNATIDEHFMLQHEVSGKSPQALPINIDASKSEHIGEEGIENEQDLCMDNQQDLSFADMDCNMLEVADSEDDEKMNVEANASALNDSCTSSCRRNSTPQSKFMQDLSIAISMAKQLQLLDLSCNGFSMQASETLYTSWSLGPRACSSWKHIKDQTVHLSVKGNICCRGKPCCRRD